MKMITALDATPDVKQVSVRGDKLPSSTMDAITSVEVEMGTDQATELVFTFDDPGFRLLASNLFDLNTNVEYRGLHLYVAVIETNEGNGLGGITIRCRPLAVKRLKRLRGDRTMHHISAPNYVLAECKTAGVGKTVVQPTKHKKKKIVRDTKQDGVTYDPATFPSAWTTMQRLASEIGYLLYEVGGTIYFGKPTWLVKHRPPVTVKWYPEDDKEPVTIPNIRQSVDAKEIEVSLSLPIRRAGSVVPGVGLDLIGFPKYSDMYFIDRVAYSLAGGDGTVTVDASTIHNPEPQPGASITTSTTPVTTTSAVKQYALDHLADYGWGPGQFEPLEKLWERESGWNYRAINHSSGATGIPQALPGNKMASAGADWRTNPETQIDWGLGYIKDRYGSPAAAWEHSERYNWY